MSAVGKKIFPSTKRKNNATTTYANLRRDRKLVTRILLTNLKPIYQYNKYEMQKHTVQRKATEFIYAAATIAIENCCGQALTTLDNLGDGLS